MKKTFFKDSIRNIKANFISWLAISIVTMIGCGVFLGILFYTYSMTDAGRLFYEKTAYEDMTVKIPFGMSEQDIEGLTGVDGVEDAEGSYVLSGTLLNVNGKSAKTEVESLTERISRPLVLEGTLPNEPGECAISDDAMKKYDIHIGDHIILEMPEDAPSNIVKGLEYKVTARVQHPKSLRNNAMVLILLPKEAFNYEKGCELYTNVHVNAFVPHEVEYLSEDYIDAVTPVIDAVKNELENMTDAGFIIIDRNNMDGYVSLRDNLSILKKLAAIFVFAFFIIGVIVVASTINIIITGQSKLVGSMKAMGFMNHEIADHYLMYGASAIFFGMILAVVLATGLQMVINSLLGSMFCIGSNRLLFKPGTYMLLSAVELIMACAVVLYTTMMYALRVSAVKLMNGDSVRSRNTETGSRKFGSLYSRLIFRNMRTDLARVIVSIVIIAGSTLIMGIGFTLYGALNNMMPASAAQINHYDIEVGEGDKEQFFELKSDLDNEDAEYVTANVTSTLMRFGKKDVGVEIFCGKEEMFPDYKELTDMNRTIAYFPEGEGILISNRLAEKNGIDIGDTVQIYDDSLSTHSVMVKGIVRYYYGSVIFLSEEEYRNIYAKNPEDNRLLLRVNGDKEKMYEELSERYQQLSYTKTDQMPESFLGIAKMFTVLVIIMTGLSIMMSIFILLNLVNILVQGRKNELIIMSINGFNYKERIGYLLKETVAITIIGLSLGTIIGCAMTESLIRTVEGGAAMFVRSVSPVSWVWAVLLESSFALVINFVAFRKIRYFQMTDITR